MESLLRWGIENTSPDAPPPPPNRIKEIDPGIIDMILGKPDSVLMKEALATGLDDNASEESRISALDDLEMLVEQIDNAKNLTPLQMYPKILSLIDPKQPDMIRMQALWILGTAVQNNPEAQFDFLKYDPIPSLLSILSPSSKDNLSNPPSPATRSKAAYALSGTLKHSKEAVDRLDEVKGWDVLKAALQDLDISIRRKVVFLINALLMPVAPGTVRLTPLAITDTSSQPLHPEGSSDTSVTALPEPTSGQAEEDQGTQIHKPQHIAIEPVSTTVPVLHALRKYQVIPALVESLVSPLPHGPNADEESDPDYTEKAARTLLTYLEMGGTLSQTDKESLKKVTKDENTKTAWGLDDDAWKTLQRDVQS